MKFLATAFLLLCLLPAHAQGGKLYAREKGKSSPIYNLLQTEVRTTVRIDDRLATTHVDERFFNDAPLTLEGFYVFELPEGAIVDGLWMWVDGERQTFLVKRKEEAERMYDSLKEAGIGDPAILSTLGANRFQLRLYPLRSGTERRIELEYFQLLPVAKDGSIRYAYPMNMSGYQTAPVEHLELTITVRGQAAIRSLHTNFDDRPSLVDRIGYGPSHREITLRAADIMLEKDFSITWSLEGWSDSLFVLTHSDASAPDSSVFLAWFPDTVGRGGDLATDVVFAIDASGSMTGMRADLVRSAIIRMLPMLTARDRIHILLFNSALKHFPSDSSMCFLTPSSAIQCTDFLQEKYRPHGITDFGMALEALHALALRPEALLRCIFITDGLANRGDRKTLELLGHLYRHQRSVVFTPVAVYSDRIEVLSDLAEITGSQLCSLQQGKDIDDALARIGQSFDTHLVSDISLTFSSGTTEIVPGVTSVGSVQESRAAGRFSPPVIGDAVLRYTIFGVEDPQKIRRPVSLRKNTASPVQIARYWAALRIEQLCSQLADLEDSTEVREAVITLSEKYNVLSPFTAFIVYQEVKSGGGTTAAGAIAAPEVLHLAQNFPNPFNPTTTITFTVPESVHAAALLRICIFDAVGHLVRLLTERQYAPGTYSLLWDGTDTGGGALPSGNYHCVLTLGAQRRVITMSYIK